MKLKRQETHFFTAIVLPLKCGLFRAGAHGAAAAGGCGTPVWEDTKLDLMFGGQTRIRRELAAVG